MTPERYAIYYLPPLSEPWAARAARWLGRDAEAGRPLAQPEPDGLALPLGAITATPRRYGLHATLKPPFRLAPGQSGEALRAACAALAETQAPARLDGLRLARMGLFLALVPQGDTGGVDALAAEAVTRLDAFRAPPGPDEIARRRGKGLSPAQERNLAAWGYPYVLDQFRFHITLTDKLSESVLDGVEAALAAHLGPLPAPLEIADIALMGEDRDGAFHLLDRFTLRG